MKKALFTLVCLSAMLAAGTGLKAQEVTITLWPGWNWISYPNAEVMQVEEALGDFIPMNGDMILSQFSNSTYVNNRWRGGVTQFMPGWGYMYYSARNEIVEFIFAQASDVSVATTTPTDITATSAVVGGIVTLPEGSHVFLRGLCWGTEPNPDIDGNHTSDGTDIGNFSSTLDNLSPNTTYYVRAYVVSDSGLSFGNEVSFTTLEDGGSGNAPEGAINGKFTINADGDQVYFSQGNLQYIGSATTPYWKFADNQWDVLGTTTGQNSSNENVDRDLFNWGTSGYNHGAVYYQPWSTGGSYSDYYAYGLWNANLNDQTGLADWGYNVISNGGNEENRWHTLTINEWDYVLRSRSGARYAKANVNGVNGIILLPDDWNTYNYLLNDVNEQGAPFNTNVITDENWMNAFEANGAVFLPAAGERYGTSVDNVGICCFYWSASYTDSSGANYMIFSGHTIYSSSARSIGLSVRLVSDVVE